MAPFSYMRNVTHPYSASNELYKHFKVTPFEHEPYSAGCVPFRWMLHDFAFGRKDGEGLINSLQLGLDENYEPDLGWETDWVQERRNQLVLLDTFFSVVREEESLCFFYVKRTPLSEDTRRVIVGVGRVKGMAEQKEYLYKKGERPMRCVIWERNIKHSIRPGFEDGFLLPYQQLLEITEQDPELDLDQFLAFAPEEYWENFSYASEHVPHDGAIAALMKCAEVLPRIGQLVSGDWDSPQKWIDRELNRLWKMRGPFPGFGSALVALGITHGNLIAYDLATSESDAAEDGLDSPWDLFESVLKKPELLSPHARKFLGPAAIQLWKGLPDERRALLELLSRFGLSEDQATRFFQPTEREKEGMDVSDRELLENPYMIFELDRGHLDAVKVEVLDRGMMADPIVMKQFPVPEPSAVSEPIDERRVRALIVDELEKAAEEGHTVQPKDWVIQSIRDRALRPACPVSGDLLAGIEESFEPIVTSVRMAEGGSAYQTEKLAITRQVISSAVNRRLKGKRHHAEYDWRALLDEEFGQVPDSADADQEKRAREEKAGALREIFESRISVLTGPAGTGKTTLLRILCSLPEVDAGGILLTAPTGKARVRLEHLTERARAQTLAQFLRVHERYEPRTGLYLVKGQIHRSTDHKTVIVDESSMMTEEQLAALIDAVSGVERLILVGDSRQLPPIGTGRPFLDIVRRLAPDDVEEKFPRCGPGYAELTVRRRQVGAERDDLLLADWFGGATPEPAADEIWNRLATDNTSEHIDVVSWSTPEELENLLLERLVVELNLQGPEDENGFEVSLGGTLYRDAVYFHPRSNDRQGAGEKAEDWQILSPVRANLFGVEALNRLIQRRFRNRALEWAVPPVDRGWMRKTTKPFGRQGILYGDKVINVVNGSRKDVFPKAEECLQYLANGEIGIVVGQYKGLKSKLKRLPWKLEVEFSTQPGFKYSFKNWEFGDEGEPPLELAYALTIHKAQGSEFSVCFVVIPDPCRLLSRELLYTALTRQHQKVILFHQGELRALRSYADPRYSEMARRLTNLFEAPKPIQIRKRFFEEGLIHKTRREEAVRSKSEVIIANLLYSMGIDYEYEKELRGSDGSCRYPDFTIEDAETGHTLYIEHLGLLADSGYRRRWHEKVEWYRDQGIQEGGGPNGSLLSTSDSIEGAIDSKEIEMKIRSALGLS